MLAAFVMNKALLKLHAKPYHFLHLYQIKVCKLNQGSFATEIQKKHITRVCM